MKPVLEVTRMEKAFGAVKATDGVDLTVLPGEIHALIGPNGAGKTCLVDQIYGSLAPDAGALLLNGRDITRLAPHRRVRLGIGRSFQISSVLQDFTAGENAVVAEAARLGRAAGMLSPAFTDPELLGGAKVILERVGLGGRADTRVREFSHGERRLLELGLALATDPALLLLDEPMAGAGPEESRRMAGIIEASRAESAILLVEHDMDVVFRLADRVTVLVEGRVAASGAPAAISGDPLVLEAYLGDAA